MTSRPPARATPRSAHVPPITCRCWRVPLSYPLAVHSARIAVRTRTSSRVSSLTRPSARAVATIRAACSIVSIRWCATRTFGTERQRSVIGHQECVMTGPIRIEPPGQVAASRCRIRDEWHGPEQHRHLGEDVVGERLAGDAQGRGSRRMRVDDRRHVRTHLIRAKVQRDFR